MFVGDDRQREVTRLLRLFEQVSRDSTPSMIVYVAPPGWGKTRIIQEFYARLTREQASPAYWPAELGAGFGEHAERLVELTASRKAVRPREVSTAGDAVPPWLWLAPAMGRISDGSLAPALDGVAGQLARHLPALLRRQTPERRGSDRLLGAVASALTLTELAAVAESTGAEGTALLDAALAEHRARLAAGAGPRSAGARAGSLSAAVAALIGGAPDQQALPVVLVLDDVHYVDAATLRFVGELLVAPLPVLVVATTWPDQLGPDRAASPFRAYLAEDGQGERVTRVILGRLHDDDLIEHLLDRFPRTDPHVAARLARRADGNPYALSLLLTTPRVLAAVDNGKLDLTPGEIDELNSGLDRLLGEHWAELSPDVRQVLVAAALLGESFHEDVLEACLRQLRPKAGLGDALASAWLQPAGSPAGIIEFIEHLRYEIARADGPNVLSPHDRDKVRVSAVRAVRADLALDATAPGRQGLLALHVALAEAGAEPDLAAAAASARELAERARSEQRRADAIRYLRLASQWWERAAGRHDAELVLSLVELTTALRLEQGKTAAEPSAVRAVEVATALGDPSLLVRALCVLGLARHRVHDDEAYGSAKELLAEAARLAEAGHELSALTVRDLLLLRASVASGTGDRESARSFARELADHSERALGRYHWLTFSAIEEFGYYSLRSGHFEDALDARRTVLDRRVASIAENGYLQTISARINLASTLLEQDSDTALGEVEQLVGEALATASRASGLDGKQAQRARLIRARLWQRRGLAAERDGDADAARELFEHSAAETLAVVTLRRAAEPVSQANALVRHGMALACLRDYDAPGVLDDALTIRREALHQHDDVWEVRRCAEALRWAYERLGRRAEAESVRKRYRLS